MIITDIATIGFRVGFAARWRATGGLVVLGWICIAVGLADVANLITDPSSVTTLGKAVFAVLGVAALTLGTGLVISGVRLGRSVAARVPVLEATDDTIRLRRADRRTLEVSRATVTSATYQFHLPTRRDKRRKARLEWFDHRGRSVAVWNLDPLIGPSLQAWMGAVGIDGTITRLDEGSGPSGAATSGRDEAQPPTGRERSTRRPHHDPAPPTRSSR